MGHRWYRLLLVCWLSGCWLFGCKGSDGEGAALSDSEGRRFSYVCGSRGCELEQSGGPRWPGPKQHLTLASTGRLAGVCNVERPGAEPAPADCRLLECETDAQCPPAEGLSTGSCVAGLCTEPSHPFSAVDAVMLCLSGTGLGSDTPRQVELFAMGMNCGLPCTAPAPCRQP